jgi:hypothetical protein
MANRIAGSGLTRNLVIRFAKDDWTASSIREDLDHIHQLEIIDIFFRNEHIYISLNSIHHAQVARSCMNSRLKYKRMKIGHWPDDCAQPLPRSPVKQPKNPLTFRSATFPGNSFELLYQETEDDEVPFGSRQWSEY